MLLGLDDPVIELAVTPDRGYCFSVRGLARELAGAFDSDFVDPATRVEVPVADGDAWPVSLDDPACARFVARRVDGVDAAAPSPWWLQRRLLAAGMRPISLVVDVTNYVMLELGQPLHAYDATRLTGGIAVRRARADETLVTLDGVERRLDPDDLLIVDDSGPIGLAGVMGGASTEIGEVAEGGTIDVVLEAAHFDPAVIARAARRHKLPSEASRRFERVVDPQLPPVAAERAARLLVEHGGGTIAPGRTDEGGAPAPSPVRMPLELPDRVAGVAYARGATVRRLQQVGCSVEFDTGTDGHGVVVATPPSWRPDLVQAADLVEEVLRLEGYDTIPSVLPPAPPGRGLTPGQLRRRAVSRALAETGSVEVLPFPFVGAAVWDAFGLPADDVRRRTVAVANPLDADRPALATTLLPGLLDALVRNRARGFTDLVLHAVEQVVLPHKNPVAMPDPDVADRPTDAEYAQIKAALPAQPVHVGVVLAGDRERTRLVGTGTAGPLGGRDRDRPARGRRSRRRAAGDGGDAAAVAPRPVRRAARRRLGRGSRRRAAPEGRRGTRPPAAHLRRRDRPRRAAAARRAPGPAGVALPAGLGGRGARDGRGRSGGRPDRGPRGRRRRPPGGGAAVRPLHRRAGGAGAALAGVPPALPRAGPDPDERGGQRRPRRGRRGGRGPARGNTALTRVTVRRAAGRARPAPRRARPRPVASAPAPPA